MPERITLNALLLCCLCTLPAILSGQTPTGNVNGFDTVRFIRPQAWYFAWESLEKALAGDPAGSSRHLFKDGNAWKFAMEDPRSTNLFYTTAYNADSWKPMSLPLEQEDRESTSAGSNASGSNDVGAVRSGMAGAASPPGSKKQGGSILYRRQFTLDESVVSGQQYFLYLDFPGKVTCWVNGQQAYSPEDDPAAAMNTPRGIELNITSLLRAGENLVALRVAGESGQVAENYPGAGEVILYTRPETHLADIEVNSTLDGSDGLVDLNLTVENRMDSVRERFFGVLREPLYSTIDMKVQLIDDKGNIVLDLNKEDNQRIQGGDRASFHFEGKVPGVKPWNHETPARYRLNLILLDETGKVLEVVSRQIGFRTVESSGPGALLVNDTEVPLRIYEPEPRPSYGWSRQQMLEDIRKIKQGNFNAVPATLAGRYRLWYELCGEHGVYVLDRVMHPSQEYGLHGTGSNPALLTVPQETLTGAGHEVVEMELGDFLKGTIRIRNAFALRDLSGYYLEWSILRNGEKTEEGRRQLEVAPGAQTMLSLDYKTRFYEGNDYFLNLRIKTKAADGMVPADFAVASRQFRLGPYRYQETYQVDKGLIDVTDGPGNIALNGYDFRIEFDKSTGQIIRYSYRGKDLMSAGPELAFGEPGDTSKNDTLEKNRILWDQAVRESTLLEYQITEDVNGNYYLSFTKILLGGDARLFQRFRIDGRGAMLVQNAFVKMQGEYPVMPGFGTAFHLPKEFSLMDWYGREPDAGHEVGVYSDTIPAAGGAKSDVRWARLTRKDGYGLLIRQESTLFHLITRRERPEGPVMLSIDLSHEPVPFKSWNFSYRVIPYSSSKYVQ